MAGPSRFGRNCGRRFWLWLGLWSVVGVGIAFAIGGCGGGGWQFPSFTTGGSGEGAAPAILPAIGDTAANLGWWLSLAGGVSIFAGLFRAWRGDLPGAATAVAVGVGLIVINGLVRLLLPTLFYGAVIGSVVLGAVAAYRLATGRGIGGHRIGCILAWVKGNHKTHKGVG